MLIDMGGPPDPPPPAAPTAEDVATAAQNLQAKLGNTDHANAAAYEARLRSAIEAIEEADAQVNRQAIAEAAILVQQRYDAQVKQVRAAGIDSLTEASSQVGLTHRFDAATLTTAAKALADSPLTLDVKPTPDLTSDARHAQNAYDALQKDKGNRAEATQLAQDEAKYYKGLSDEYNAAAGEANSDWRSNVTQIDRGWQAQQTVLDLNTTNGPARSPSRADLLTSLNAAQVLDDARTARGSGDASGNSKSAKVATQGLQDVRSDSPLLQPFGPLPPTTTNSAPMSLYQPLVGQSSKNAPLGQWLDGGTGLLPTAPAPGSAPQDAAQLSTAMSALSDARAKNKSPADVLAAAKQAQPLVNDTTWAQALILRGAVTDGQKWTAGNAQAIKAGNAPVPDGMVKQSADELGGEQLFDANTIANATVALQSGSVYAVPNGSAPKGSGQIDPLSELSQYQAMGISLPAAVVMVRQEMGGGADNEQVIMQAAVTLAGEQYASDPTQADPIAAGLKQLQQSAPNLFSQDEQKALDSVAQSMEQKPTVDQNALTSAITKAQLDQRNLDAANQLAQQNPKDASAQQAAAAALTTYQADLTAALNIAGGHHSTDSGWQAQAANVDSLWKAQFTVAAQMLQPQIEAAQGTAKDSKENRALDTAFGALQISLQAVHIIQQTLYEQKAKADGGAGGGNVGATHLLTSQFAGVPKDSDLCKQVMQSDAITSLEKSVRQDVLGGLPLQFGNADDTTKQLVALGNRLSVYRGTILYATVLQDTLGAAQTQALFVSVATQVKSKSNPLDRLKALASVTQGVTPDLAAALNRARFSGDVLQWVKQDGTTSALQPVAQIYANIGSSQNPDMTAVRQWLEQAMQKSSGDGGVADLHTTTAPGKFGWETGKSNVTLVYGLDSLKSEKDKSQMQLFQDILDDRGVASAVTKEIEKETGYQASGRTAAALAPDDTGNLDGLSAVDGMQSIASFNKAVDTIGKMEGLAPTHAPQSLDDVRADELGTRSLYDPNAQAYTFNGKPTTVGDMARQMMSGEGVSQISEIDPLMLASLSLAFQGKDNSTWQGALLEGSGQDGNYVDVGPADTHVRNGLNDWYQHSGFSNGQVQVQAHWVLGANGQPLLGDAYFDTHRTGVHHWYDWDNIQAGLMVAAAIVTVAAMPEAAPLWLEGLSLALDGYFAVSSGIQAQQAFAHDDAKQGWMDVAFAAAGVFGGALSSAKMLGRLGAASSRFAEASGLAKLAEQGKGVKAYRNASLASWLDDSRLGGWATPKLATGVRIANRIDGPMRLIDANGRRIINTMGIAHRALSFTSMGLGIVQMGEQGLALMGEGDQATGEDWLRFFTGMTATAIGTAGARVHAARTKDKVNGEGSGGAAPSVVTAANFEEPTPKGSGEETSSALAKQRTIALATFKLALAQATAQAAAAMRAATAAAGAAANRVANAASQVGTQEAGSDTGNAGGRGDNGGDSSMASSPLPGPTPQESLDALLNLALERGARSADNVYYLYGTGGGAPPRAPLTADQSISHLEKARALVENRPENSEEQEQNTMDPLAEFLDANPDGGGKTYYHFLPPEDIGPEAGDVHERIHINAVPEHALDVMTFLVRHVMDDHQSYPGIYSAKVTSPAATHTRVDNILVYAKDSEAVDRIVAALGRYQETHLEHFDGPLPLMTRPVLRGVSVAAEVTPEMGNESFGGVRANAIWKALDATYKERDSRNAKGEPFDAIAFLREQARVELARAGVDPNDPSRNLPPDPSASNANGPNPNFPDTENGENAVETEAGDPVYEALSQVVDGRHVVVFGGYSGLGYARPDLIDERIASILRSRIDRYGADNLLVVVGATPEGIGRAYSIAKGLGLRTAGIVSELGAEYASPDCDFAIPVSDPSGTWQVLDSEGHSYMVAVARPDGEYIALGGGEVTLKEAQEASAYGDVQVTIDSSFDPEPAAVAKRRERDPAFDPQPALDQLAALAAANGQPIPPNHRDSSQ